MTFAQKFILSLVKDSFFKEEGNFILKKWDIKKKNKKNIFLTARTEYDLPLEYLQDLQFILVESGLPNRFIWPLHKYLISRKIPELAKLPRPVRVSFSSSEVFRGLSKILIEVDLDAGKRDILGELGDISFLKELSKKIHGASKKYSPIRNFDDLKKIITYKNSRDELAEEIAGEDMDVKLIGKATAKAKNQIKTRLSRYKKGVAQKKRYSVKDRIAIEKNLPKPDW